MLIEVVVVGMKSHFIKQGEVESKVLGSGLCHGVTIYQTRSRFGMCTWETLETDPCSLLKMVM